MEMELRFGMMINFSVDEVKIHSLSVDVFGLERRVGSMETSSSG